MTADGVDETVDQPAGNNGGTGLRGRLGVRTPRTRRGRLGVRTPRTRRGRLIVRSAVAVVVVAAIVGATYGIMSLLTDDGTSGRPVVTATAGGTTLRVEPYQYCDPTDPTDCDPPGDTAELTVTADTPVTIEVPDAIAQAPWSLKRYYVAPGVQQSDVDSLIPEEKIFAPGSTHEVTVPPVDDSGHVLAGVEITLPTGIVDRQSDEVTYIDHATWSISAR